MIQWEVVPLSSLILQDTASQTTVYFSPLSSTFTFIIRKKKLNQSFNQFIINMLKMYLTSLLTFKKKKSLFNTTQTRKSKRRKETNKNHGKSKFG